MTKTREITIGGLLIALALVIPLTFGQYLRVVIPPFSATLASHVPVFLAMLVSPFVAAFVGLGSAIGFFITSDPVIAARASVHILVGLVGAVMVKKGFPYWSALLAALPVHALGEMLIVVPFGFKLGFTLHDPAFVVGVGTAVHHLIDAGISIAIAGTLGLAVRGYGKTTNKFAVMD